jgi:hypothetical protein
MSELIGYVTEQAGPVDVLHETTGKQSLSVHMAVYENDRIQTGVTGVVSIVLNNGTVLRIGPGEEVLLEKSVSESEAIPGESQAEAAVLQQLIVQSGDVIGLDETAVGAELIDGSGLIHDAVTVHDENPGYAAAEGMDTEFRETSGMPLADSAPVDETLPPLAEADNAHALEGGPAVVGTVAANDSDPDGDALSYTLTGEAPAGLDFHADGTYVFDPTDPAYGGLKEGETYHIISEYEVSDGRGGSDTALLIITLHGTGEMPNASLYSDTGDDTSLLSDSGVLDFDISPSIGKENALSDAGAGLSIHDVFETPTDASGERTCLFPGDGFGDHATLLAPHDGDTRTSDAAYSFDGHYVATYDVLTPLLAPQQDLYDGIS